MIAIALFTMAGCAVVDKNMVATEYSKTTDSCNIAEKLISLINDYTDKINAVESVYDLFLISEKCYKEKMSFEKNYAEEIATFKSSLTEEDAIKTHRLQLLSSKLGMVELSEAKAAEYEAEWVAFEEFRAETIQLVDTWGPWE